MQPRCCSIRRCLMRIQPVMRRTADAALRAAFRCGSASTFTGVHGSLAAAVLPPILITFTRGLRRDDLRHRQIARKTLPVWLFVSVTGVIVYLMLYRLPL